MSNVRRVFSYLFAWFFDKPWIRVFSNTQSDVCVEVVISNHDGYSTGWVHVPSTTREERVLCRRIEAIVFEYEGRVYVSIEGRVRSF